MTERPDPGDAFYAAFGRYAFAVLRLYWDDLEELTYDLRDGFGVIVNDVFWWGTGESEPVEAEDVPALETAFRDVRAVVEYPKRVATVASVLYAARRRKLRPQGAYYSYLPEALWPAFDACGPPREVGYGNPYQPGGYHSDIPLPLRTERNQR